MRRRSGAYHSVHAHIPTLPRIGKRASTGTADLTEWQQKAGRATHTCEPHKQLAPPAHAKQTALCAVRGGAHVSRCFHQARTSEGGRAQKGGEGAGGASEAGRNTQHESPTTAQPSLLMRVGVH